VFFLVRCAKAPRRAGRTLADLDLVAPVAVEIHDDEASADAAARRHADGLCVHDRREWGLAVAISTTTRSQGLATAKNVANVVELWQSGSETKLAEPCRRLGRLRILLAHKKASDERVRKYRAAGIRRCLRNWRATIPISWRRRAADHHRRRR